MADFVLSLLSRGYGQIVPGEGGHDGRLEVCFEPEDYFNWKSKPPLLHLTSSGQFLGGMEPVPPKTYSTRRGPLILYSEDLALSYQSGQVRRKRKAPGGPKQEVDYQLHTLQDLTGAILAYGKKQQKVGSVVGVINPLLPDTKHATQLIFMDKKSTERDCNLNQAKVSAGKDGQIRYQPRFLCSPRPNRATLDPLPPITKGLVHIQSQEKTHQTPVSAEKFGQIRYQPSVLCSPRPNRTILDPLPPITEGLVHVQSQEKIHQAPDEQMAIKVKDQQKPEVKMRQCLKIGDDTCRAPISPIPETTAAPAEPADQPKDQTILPQLTDRPTDLNGGEKHRLMENRGGVGHLRSVYVDSSLECSPLSRINYYGGHMEGFRQMKHCGGETHMRRMTIETDPSLTICHLPAVNQRPLVNSDSHFSTFTINKPRINNMESCENSPQQEQKVHLPDVKLETTFVKHPEKKVHSKLLVLLPAQTEHKKSLARHDVLDDLHGTPVEDNKPCGDMEHKEELPQKRLEPQSDSRCRIIEMDLGHEIWSDALEKRDQHPPLGTLPPLVGRRGPGKQSSMAVYSQNFHDPADTTEPQTGNIRGCLPLELRERQGGEATGTLIMGPDGEIIRLSLWDPVVDTEDHPIMADVTQGHVLKVVTSEGDLKQPWMILIQDCATDQAGDVTTHDAGETTSKKEQLDSNHEVFMVNKPAEQTNAKRRKNRFGSYNKKVVKTQVNTPTKTNAEEEEQKDKEQEEEQEEVVEEQEEEEEVEEYSEEEQEEVVEVQEYSEEEQEEVQEEEKEVEEHWEEEEEDCSSSDNEMTEKAQAFLVHAYAKQNNTEDDDNHLGFESKLIQEAQVFMVNSQVKQTNAKKKKRKRKYLGSDTEIIQESQLYKVSSRTKPTNAQRNEDGLGSDSDIIQEVQHNSHVKHTNAKKKKKKYLVSHDDIIQEEEVCLPEERSEELNRSTTHQPSRQGEGTTAVQRKRKAKTTTLQPETGVTLGSRKSKGSAPAISPKSTQFTPSTDTPGQSQSAHEKAEIPTGLPMEAAFASKGHSKNTGGKEDASRTRLENVRENKIKKQTSKSKRKTVQMYTDDETHNTRVSDDTTSTLKQKTKKTKEMPEEERAGPTESQKQKAKVKKKKVQPAFVVGKPRPQEVEWIANQVDESKTLQTYEREAMSPDTMDDELDNSASQEHIYNESGDDMDADSVSTETHKARDSPQSVYSTHRSQKSHFTARSEPGTHRLSQRSHRTTSVGVAAQCSPCSPAPLSLIHLPPQLLASGPTSESGKDAKTREEPIQQIDTKATALADRAERRRLEVERKRREKEEEKKRQQEKEEREERMRIELEEEQKKRAEETKLRKIREEEDRRRKEEEEMERQRREQAQKERDRRHQEEKRRLIERLQRERQEEEKRQAAEMERQRLEEEARREAERIKLSEMEESERLEYLRRQQEEEEERRKAREERKRKDEEAAMHAEEEARLQAELFARQRAALEQHLKFHRGLFVESEGLEQTQDVSRPWVFSYFALLKLLGLAEPTSDHEDTLTDVL